MTDFFAQHPLIVIVAALLILALLFLLFRPRQRVTLTDSAPIRPHMATSHETPPPSDVPVARVHHDLPASSGAPDDLLLLKGVGPRLAEILHARGITRFDQIAKLSDGQVETLDASLGAFSGRFGRDRIVEQADYLARGDTDGFEQKFGKL